jgi:hypothetical protein
MSDMQRCLEDLRANFATADVINRRGDRAVIRWRGAESRHCLIVKMWARPGAKSQLRRVLKLAPSQNEWRNLHRLTRARIAVPRPLGFCRITPKISAYTEALFMEDLGSCESGTDYLKRLLRSGDDGAASAFEDLVIEMTQRLVNAGMLDEDHGFLNIVVPKSGQPVRLDLELCRKVVWPELFPASYGRMLGRLLGLHAFAVQPEVGRTERFAGRLRQQLVPPTKVLVKAGAHAREMMEKQRSNVGIDTKLVLPWD